MTLNGVIALILLYITELAFRASYVTVVEDRPILSAEYRLPCLAKTNPPCSAVSAIAELLVRLCVIFDQCWGFTLCRTTFKL